MHASTERPLAIVARRRYSAELSAPLKKGETPDNKLPRLMAELGVATHLEVVVALLVAHVIGHNVRDYGVDIRGAPRTGLAPHLRAPLVLRHFGVTTYRAAALKLATRHVPGFRPMVVASVGRKDALATVGHPREDLDAELEDLFDFIFDDEIAATGKRLTRGQIAKRIVKTSGESWFGLDAKQVVSRYKQGKRRRERSYKRDKERAAKYRNLVRRGKQKPLN